MASTVKCSNCGKLITGRLGVPKLCWDCHCSRKANNAERDKTETRRARLLEANEGLTALDWTILLRLYDNTCVYCMKKFDQLDLEQDHVISLANGGSHSFTNVVPACMPCNRHKSTGGMLVKHPMFGKLLAQAVKAERNSTTPALP